jgi:DNA-binding response OmpR family regulator
MIALGLRYRGLDVIEASSPDDLLDLKRCPDLILLDIDGEVGNRAVALAEVQANPILTFLPIVMLTWDTSNLSEPDEDHENAKETPARQSRHTTLAKPFDARSLYAVIETQLHQNYWLPAVEEQYAQSDSHVISRISYTPPASPAAPSLCPMLTAAGLMLAFIGLMLQLAITAVGLLIVIAALLWWTLGTKPESLVVARS